MYSRAVAWFGKRRGKKSSDDKSAPKLSRADLEVVSQMVKHGADMSQPRHVLYYSYFPTADAARTAALAAEQRLFMVQVSEPSPEQSDRWRMLCERKSAVLSEGVIKENSEFFSMLARQGRGEYDGWEASIQPTEGNG